MLDASQTKQQRIAKLSSDACNTSQLQFRSLWQSLYEIHHCCSNHTRGRQCRGALQLRQRRRQGSGQCIPDGRDSSALQSQAACTHYAPHTLLYIKCVIVKAISHLIDDLRAHCNRGSSGTEAVVHVPQTARVAARCKVKQRCTQCVPHTTSSTLAISS